MTAQPDRPRSVREEKELDARRRDCLDEQRTHIRAGWWWGEEVESITMVGHVRDLHGTVCTCCPKRAAS